MKTEEPVIVGILNVTPDSFSDGGRWPTPAAQVEAAERMVAAGAGVVEIGGESTRPGALPVTLEEELGRVVPVIRELRKRLAVLLAVDTVKAEVARQAAAEGVDIINDVTALRGDSAMAGVVRESGVRVVLMHMKGIPRTMQDDPRYEDVIGEIRAFLDDRIRHAERAGIDRERIVLDPGIGFGKRVSDNLRLLRDLDRLRTLECPLMIGASRKSFIGEVTGRSVSDRVIGTCVANCFALWGGARYLRVHDVAPARDVVRLFRAVREAATAYDVQSANGPARR